MQISQAVVDGFVEIFRIVIANGKYVRSILIRSIPARERRLPVQEER